MKIRNSREGEYQDEDKVSSLKEENEDKKRGKRGYGGKRG